MPVTDLYGKSSSMSVDGLWTGSEGRWRQRFVAMIPESRYVGGTSFDYAYLREERVNRILRRKTIDTLLWEKQNERREKRSAFLAERERDRQDEQIRASMNLETSVDEVNDYLRSRITDPHLMKLLNL